MTRHIDQDKKHKTGRASGPTDFLKHKCPGQVIGYLDDKPIRSKPALQKRGLPENFVFVNRFASDKCSQCGADIDDESAGWENISNEEYERLSGQKMQGDND